MSDKTFTVLVAIYKVTGGRPYVVAPTSAVADEANLPVSDVQRSAGHLWKHGYIELLADGPRLTPAGLGEVEADPVERCGQRLGA